VGWERQVVCVMPLMISQTRGSSVYVRVRPLHAGWWWCCAQEAAARRAERGAADGEAVAEVLGAAAKAASQIAKKLL
jgi:hypothetical protein